MNSLAWLILLSFAMLTGSFLAGNIPLAFHFSDEKLRTVSTFGAGLLVGTALIVILPEGVETLYSIKHDHEQVNQDINHSSFNSISLNNQLSKDDLSFPVKEGAKPDLSHSIPSSALSSPSTSLPRSPSTMTEKRKASSYSFYFFSSDSSHEDFQTHKHIGWPLAVGFAFMFIIDQIGQGHSHGPSPSHITVSDFRETNLLPPKKISATLGLIVHAAADGIALGAASASNQTSLELIVFLAIMLHKAPSAFGLSTYLLHEGYPRKMIRQHLLAFSLSAPISAIITRCILNTGTLEDPFSMRKWTGILLLFSAGTFLYVATVHILPEIYVAPVTYPNTSSTSFSTELLTHGNGHGNNSNSNSDHDANHHHAHHEGAHGLMNLSSLSPLNLINNPSNNMNHSNVMVSSYGDRDVHINKKLSLYQIIALLIGIFAPLFLTVEHKH